MLKGTEESRVFEPDATTGLCFKDAQESVLDSFAFANAAARDEIEPLAGSLVRNATSTFRPASRRIRSTETRGAKTDNLREIIIAQRSSHARVRAFCQAQS